jgi:hypothetical protein
VAETLSHHITLNCPIGADARHLALSVSLENGYFPPETLSSRMQEALEDCPLLFGETEGASPVHA